MIEQELNHLKETDIGLGYEELKDFIDYDTLRLYDDTKDFVEDTIWDTVERYHKAHYKEWVTWVRICTDSTEKGEYEWYFIIATPDGVIEEKLEDKDNYHFQAWVTLDLIRILNTAHYLNVEVDYQKAFKQLETCGNELEDAVPLIKMVRYLAKGE